MHRRQHGQPHGGGHLGHHDADHGGRQARQPTRQPRTSSGASSSPATWPPRTPRSSPRRPTCRQGHRLADAPRHGHGRRQPPVREDVRPGVGDGASAFNQGIGATALKSFCAATFFAKSAAEQQVEVDGPRVRARHPERPRRRRHHRIRPDATARHPHRGGGAQEHRQLRAAGPQPGRAWQRPDRRHRHVPRHEPAGNGPGPTCDQLARSVAGHRCDQQVLEEAYAASGESRLRTGRVDGVLRAADHGADLARLPRDQPADLGSRPLLKNHATLPRSTTATAR